MRRCSRNPAMPRMPSAPPTRCGGTTGTWRPVKTSSPASSRSIATAGHDRRSGYAIHGHEGGGQVIDPESVCDSGRDQRAIRSRVDHQPERPAAIDHHGRDDAADPVQRRRRRKLRSGVDDVSGRLDGCERGSGCRYLCRRRDRGGGCRKLRRGREFHAPQPRKRAGRDHQALHEDQYGRRPAARQCAPSQSWPRSSQWRRSGAGGTARRSSGCG